MRKIELGVPPYKIISSIIPDNLSLTEIKRDLILQLASKNNPFYINITQLYKKKNAIIDYINSLYE